MLQRTIRKQTTAAEGLCLQRVHAHHRALSVSPRQIQRVVFGTPVHEEGSAITATAEGLVVTETIARRCKHASKQPFWCLFLFHLIREFRPQSCLELGTSLGVSGMYQAAALQLNGAGRLVTIEGDATLAGLARENFAALTLANAEVVQGRFERTLPGVLGDHGPVDLVFIDGGKNDNALLQQFEDIYPFLMPEAILLIDDIYWSSKMTAAWQILKQDRRIRTAIDLYAVGVCSVSKDGEAKTGTVI